jgi:hypothetical protein
MLNDHMPVEHECPGDCDGCKLWDICELDLKWEYCAGDDQA